MTISATLTPDEAADRLWDVLIVGAGPAGALAARELSLRGLRVLLLDRASFPRAKVCGSCFNHRALHTLSELGLNKLVADMHGIPLEHFHMAVAGKGVSLRLPAGAAISRQRFDAALIEAAVEAGASFLSETVVHLGSANEDTRSLVLRQHRREVKVTGRIVLAASGLPNGSQLSGSEIKAVSAPDSRLGAAVFLDQAPDWYTAGTIYMACGTAGYVGLVRVEDGRLNIATALAPEQVKRAGGLGRAAETVLAEAGFPALDNLADAPWRGTAPLSWRVPTPAGHRIFLIGDAAGYVEPFTGEGIAWALASAQSVVPLAAQGCRRWNPDLVQRRTRLHWQKVGQRQWICRGMARLLRSPWLTNTMVGSLARAPILAMPLIRMICGSGPEIG